VLATPWNSRGGCPSPEARERGTEVAQSLRVTVRITVVKDRRGRLIHVVGRLSEEEIEELEQTIGDDLTSTRLELSELRSADAAALTLLRRLQLQGVELHGLSPHLAWRIDVDSQ